MNLGSYTLAKDTYDIVLKTGHFLRHGLLLGTTGCGKSYLFLRMLMHLAVKGIPFSFLDRDGDTVRKLYCLLKKQRIPCVLLRPGEKGFKCDPFDASDDASLPYRIEEIATIAGIYRGVQDYKEQPRRERVMIDVLYLCGQRNKEGKYLGLHMALRCLTFNDYWDKHIFGPLAECLPEEIAEDLLDLRFSPPAKRRDEIQSTINWFRQFLSPIVREIVKPCEYQLDFDKLASEGMLLADLQEVRDVLSPSQADAIGGLIKFKVLNAKGGRPRVLAMDEADKLNGHDIDETFKRGRKEEVYVWLGYQASAGLRDRFNDLFEVVINNAGWLISGQVKGTKDLDSLEDYFASMIYDFTERYRPMDRPDGVDWLEMWEPGFSETDTQNLGFSLNQSQGNSDGDNWTDTSSRARSEQESYSQQESSGVSSQRGTNRTHSEGENHSQTQSSNSTRGGSSSSSKTKGSSRRDSNVGFNDSETEGSSVSYSEGDSNGRSIGLSRSESHGESESEGENYSESNGHTTGTGLTLTDGSSFGGNHSRSHTQGSGLSLGQGASRGRTLTRKMVHIPRYREEWYPVGLEMSLEVQRAKVRKLLRMLPERWFVIAVGSLPPTVFRSADLEDCDWRFFEKRHELWKLPCFFDTPEIKKWNRPYLLAGTPGSSNGAKPQNGSKTSKGSKGSKPSSQAKKPSTAEPSN